MSSPLGHHGDEIDHLAFLQEPMSDEEDELDVENIQKDTASSSQRSTASAVGESQNTSLFKEGQFKTQTISGKFEIGLLRGILCM
jgi:hypothetical protein